jgi:DeoR/GlpR family transcriptional regulator of sugar metabolism
MDSNENKQNMFIEERLDRIINLVQEKNKVTVKEVVDFLGVSIDTVRRDFTRLKEKGLVLRTHGGIISKESVSFDPGISEKIIQFKQEKEKIGFRAANLINDSEIIIIDAGTTTEEIVKHILDKKDLTVVTDALNIALATTRANINTIILGGSIRISTLSVVGPDAINMIKNYHADKVLLGVSAISVEKGLMVPNRMEAEMKKGLIEMANQIIVLADHSKINKTALYSFASISAIDVLITDSKANPAFIEELRNMDIEVIIV